MNSSIYNERYNLDTPDTIPDKINVYNQTGLEFVLDENEKRYTLKTDNSEIGTLIQMKSCWMLKNSNESGFRLGSDQLAAIARTTAYLNGKIIKEKSKHVERIGGISECNHCGEEVLFRLNTESDNWLPVDLDKSSFTYIPYWDRYFHYVHIVDCDR